MIKRPKYKKRFENLRRVVRHVTSSLDIGDILEIIRDEVKVSVPAVKETCLLMFDQEAAHYTRPLHCSVYKERINCQLCKRGRGTIKAALDKPSAFQCSSLTNDREKASNEKSNQPICEVAIPINFENKPLAVLDVIAKEGQSFADEDIMILSDLSDLAANALINTRNHWKLTQEKLNMDQILTHLRPFVPETVQKIVEKDPSAPYLDKQDMDISVLFLDVAGYTKISESLTQEKVNFIIEKYFSSFLDVIYHHKGDINETAGDGLMVIFQGSSTENALHASKAATDIRGRTKEINRELKGRFAPIEVNMGINSGTASVGMTRFHGTTGTRMTFTASGSVTNLAARIAAAATHGDILVGPETATRIKIEMTLYDRGFMRFKNVKEPVQVFSLIRQ